MTTHKAAPTGAQALFRGLAVIDALAAGARSLAAIGEAIGLARSTTHRLALAPARLLGLTGGVFNFVGNLSSICVPIVIGLLIEGDDFAPAITYIALMALIGALSYGLLVGKVERIQE